MYNISNIKITEIPKSIRTNNFNLLTGKFNTSKPVVREINIGNQKLSSVYYSGGAKKKSFYSY